MKCKRESFKLTISSSFDIKYQVLYVNASSLLYSCFASRRMSFMLVQSLSSTMHNLEKLSDRLINLHVLDCMICMCNRCINISDV